MIRLQQQPLEPETEPATVIVNGSGLLHWGERIKTGEVHIYKMVHDLTRPGIYTLSLVWLHGRQLYRHGDKPQQFATTETPHPTTLASIGQSAESPKVLGRPGNETLMRNPLAVTDTAAPTGNADANTFKPQRPAVRAANVQEALKLFRS